MTDPYDHRIELLSTPFRYPAQRLLFARARLYLDRIELSGRAFGGKHTAQIRWEEVERIAWCLTARGAREPNATFHLVNGQAVALVLGEVHRWQDMLEERLAWGDGRPGEARPARMLFAATPDLPFHDLVAYASSMS